MKVECTQHTCPPYSTIAIKKVILRQMMHQIFQYLEALQPLITEGKYVPIARVVATFRCSKPFTDVQPKTFCTWQTVIITIFYGMV